MLKNRIITAVILIPIVISFIFLVDTLWFALLFSAFATIGAWEWAGLCKLKSIFKTLYSLSIVLILAAIYWLDSRSLYVSVIMTGAVYWLIGITLVVAYQKERNLLTTSPLFLIIIGLFLLIPMWSSLVLLKSSITDGASLVMCLMLLIWGADTGAYFVGKKWGKRKLASRVSPGKTWEGTVGGFVSAVVITICYVVILKMNISDNVMFFGVAILTIIVSVFGDLMESLVKREADQKDSGNIFPGHGGVMDRVDSLTAAGPVFVTGLICLGMV